MAGQPIKLRSDVALDAAATCSCSCSWEVPIASLEGTASRQRTPEMTSGAVPSEGGDVPEPHPEIPCLWIDMAVTIGRRITRSWIYTEFTAVTRSSRERTWILDPLCLSVLALRPV